jgi:His-Xaa-Ser repeat protein HxsA
MLSFGAVAQDKKQESQGAQSSSSATQGAASGASSPSASGDKSQRSAGAGSSMSKAGGQGSETVKQVQTKLKEQGQDPGPADGIMGPKTQAALKEFQKDKGLKETGRLDPQTLSALGVSGSASAGGSSARSEKKDPGAASGGSAAAGAGDKPGEKKQ